MCLGILFSWSYIENCKIRIHVQILKPGPNSLHLNDLELSLVHSLHNSCLRCGTNHSNTLFGKKEPASHTFILINILKTNWFVVKNYFDWTVKHHMLSQFLWAMRGRSSSPVFWSIHQNILRKLFLRSESFSKSVYDIM